MQHDLVREALTQPIAWQKFESVVIDVLRADDMPDIRKLGGGNDGGADGECWSFFENASVLDQIIQVTSEKTQKYKVQRTLNRLEETRSGEVTHLTVVFRDPVESGVRRAIVGMGRPHNISIDVRDEEYLVSQLGSVSNAVFARHFLGVRAQVDALLSVPDPLGLTSTRSRRALLAAMGAYVVRKERRNVRGALFEQSVLACVVAAKSPSNVEDLAGEVQRIFPAAQVTPQRVRDALTTLQRRGMVTSTATGYDPSSAALQVVGGSLARLTTSFRTFFAECIARMGRVNDATKGRIERNAKRSILHVLRSLGPLDSFEGPNADIAAAIGEDSVTREITRGLTPAEGSKLASVLADLLQDRAYAPQLAVMARTYAALLIRNLDPAGRAWQRNTLRRNSLCLDTDAVLYLTISELPEHSPLRDAVASLCGEGIRLVVTPHVLVEAADHISRADRTWERFGGRLARMPSATVNTHVWHAVVRGYYYARQADQSLTWNHYWDGYRDSQDPVGYVRHLLSSRGLTWTESLPELDDADHEDSEEIATTIHEKKEQRRNKAQFRDDQQKLERVLNDVRMALAMAQSAAAAAEHGAKGYLATIDGAFKDMERHASWRTRPRIALGTRVLPEVAEFLCGVRIDDDKLVSLLFEPLVGAAALALASEIDTLTAVGVDLKNVRFEKLDWELQRNLRTLVHDLESDDPKRAENDAAKEDVGGAGDASVYDQAVNVLRSAAGAGFDVDPRMARVLQNHHQLEEVVQRLEQERTSAAAAAAAADERAAEARADLARVAHAAAGTTKRGRRQVRRALEAIDINLDELLQELDQRGSADGGAD